jgi:hypothetical protein
VRATGCRRARCSPPSRRSATPWPCGPARAALERAQANLTDAQAGLARRDAAEKTTPGLVRGEEVETYRARVETARADVAAATVQVDQALLNQRDAAVRAPMDGVIQTRDARTGQYAQPGALIATLLRRDPLLLRFSLPEADAGSLKAGDEVRFTLSGVPTERGSGAVNITDVSIKNPVFAWMLMASTMLFGLVAITRIGISQYPDVDYPNITVSSVSWEGAAPSAVEREIVEPLEQAISQVEGVKQISSSARQGGRVTATFDISRNVDLALQDVQAKVAQAQRRSRRDVPAASPSRSRTPTISPSWSASPAPSRGSCSPTYARYQVQEKLQTVPGVGQITSAATSTATCASGSTQPLAEKGVDGGDVINAIRGASTSSCPRGRSRPGGRQINVRLLGEALDLDAARIVVRQGGGSARSSSRTWRSSRTASRT